MELLWVEMMIKHEEARKILNGNEKNLSITDIVTKLTSGEYTLLAIKLTEKEQLEVYITEQEKKDELLELYKKLHDTYRYPTWKSVKDVQCILKQIKALEEEMK